MASRILVNYFAGAFVAAGALVPAGVVLELLSQPLKNKQPLTAIKRANASFFIRLQSAQLSNKCNEEISRMLLQGLFYRRACLFDQGSVFNQISKTQCWATALISSQKLTRAAYF